MNHKPAHILTDRQLKGALATVKKKPKLPKNVLIRNEEDYWPALNEIQRAKFVGLLETFCLQSVDYKYQLAIGLQSVLRNIKEGNIKILVLTSEFSPRLFAKHVLAMTVHLNQKTKVFFVPKLKELTGKLMQAPTVIFGFKSSADTTELEKFYDLLGTHSELLRNYLSPKPVIDVSIKKKKKPKRSVETPVVLLPKINESTHSFVPMETDSIESQTPVDQKLSSDFISLTSSKAQPSADFISLSKYSDNSLTLSNSSLPPYRPIKIMKVPANPNRKAKNSHK